MAGKGAPAGAHHLPHRPKIALAQNPGVDRAGISRSIAGCANAIAFRADLTEMGFFARKLAVILHRMWNDATGSGFGKEARPA
ncbi:hypothetical protein [Mesorhizobium sp. M0220]|uniref:hypothetical protein n=1 Tax=Mesorhizobium sp. M0220 TaxID=2956920 RepID=UPI00333686AD